VLSGKCWQSWWELRELWWEGGSHAHTLHGILYQQSLGERVKVRVWPCSHHLRTLESLPSPQKRSIVEHVLCHGVQSPEISFSWISWFSGDFHKTIIEREIVADRVLPGREPLFVVWKPCSDELADPMEGEALPGRLDDGHGDHGYVGVWRLHNLASLF